MAQVLTVGEQQLVADHLRAGLHTAGRVAAIELTLLAAGTVLGHGLGLLIGHSAYALHRLRSRRLPTTRKARP